MLAFNCVAAFKRSLAFPKYSQEPHLNAKILTFEVIKKFEFFVSFFCAFINHTASPVRHGTVRPARIRFPAPSLETGVLEYVNISM